MKKSNCFKTFWFVCISFTMVASMANAGDIVPNSFSTGDVVSAAKMNQNFEELESAVSGALDVIYLGKRELSDDRGDEFSFLSDAIFVKCASGEILTAATVSCTSDNFNSDTTNWGIVVDQTIYQDSEGDWAVYGECSADALFYDSGKFGPPIKVQLICGTWDDVGSAYASSSSLSVYVPDDAENEKSEMSDDFKAFLQRKKAARELRRRSLK